MRRLAILALLAGCTMAQAAEVRVSGPTGDLIAPGDSLSYGLSWGAAQRATSYLVTVSASATNGTWTGLPSSQAVLSGTTLSFKAVSLAWDSATFTAVVQSVDAVGPTGKTSTVSWRVRRRATAPGPITVDSSLVITGIIVAPHDTVLVVGASLQFCAFLQFKDSAVANPGYQVLRGCLPSYVALGRRAPSAQQQAVADTACVVWSSSDTKVATITTTTCSSTGMYSPRREAPDAVAARRRPDTPGPGPFPGPRPLTFASRSYGSAYPR